MRRDVGRWYPQTAPTLRVGVPVARGWRGYLTVAVRALLLPVGLGLFALTLVIVRAADGRPAPVGILLRVLMYVDVLAGTLFVFAGLVAWTAGLRWRRRGRPLCGVAFYPDERPAVVQLVSRTGTRYLPVSRLDGFEVRHSREWRSDHDPEPTADPWLCLSFRNPANGRATTYLITPDYYARGPAVDAGFSRAVDGLRQTPVELADAPE